MISPEQSAEDLAGIMTDKLSLETSGTFWHRNSTSVQQRAASPCEGMRPSCLTQHGCVSARSCLTQKTGCVSAQVPCCHGEVEEDIHGRAWRARVRLEEKLTLYARNTISDSPGAAPQPAPPPPPPAPVAAAAPERLCDHRAGRRAPTEAWRVLGSCLAEVLNAPAVRAKRRIDEEDDIRFEAALRRQKDSKGSAKPLNRREAFRAAWREGQWGSDADADLAEQRFQKRVSRCRAGRGAPPEAWLLPGSRLAEALGL